MSNYAFLYDPTANNIDNKIVEELHPLSNYRDMYTTVMPIYGPFFRESLIIRHEPSGMRLYEGIDYALGHKFKSGSEAVGRMLFGSVCFLDSELADNVVFEEYHTLGGYAIMPRAEQLAYLAKLVADPVDPRNVLWDDILKYPPVIEPVSGPTTLDEAIASDIITSNLNDLSDQLAGSYAATSAAYDALIAKVAVTSNNSGDISISDHLATSNPHQTTAAQTHSLPVDGTAVNSDLAYSLTRDQLVTAIQETGFDSSALDDYLRQSGGLIDKALTLDTNMFSSSTMTELTENNAEEFITVGNRQAYAGEDETLAESILAAKTIAFDTPKLTLGVKVPSKLITANVVITPDTFTIDGYTLITDKTIADYPISVDPDAISLTPISSDDVLLSGSGIESSPLTGTVLLPLATDTIPGIIKTSNDPLSTSVSTSPTAYAYSVVIDDWVAGVSNDITVNGKLLSSNPVLTRVDFGLDLIDLTNEYNKPLTSALDAALDQYSLKGHTHLTDTLPLDIATTTNYGIAKLTATKDADNTSDALAASVVAELATLETSVTNSYYALVDNVDADIRSYSTYSYLPAPVSGSYVASGYGGTQIAGAVEDNGVFVLLRPGKDISNVGIYYSYCNVDSDGKIIDIIPTTVRYNPSWAISPLTNISTASESAFIAIDSAGRNYLVITNGTMNSLKHSAASFTTVGVGFQHKPIVVGDYVYLLYYSISNAECLVMAWRAPVATIENETSFEWEALSLSGLQANGNPLTNVTRFNLTDVGLSRDPDSNCFCIDKSGPAWVSRSLHHAAFNFEVGTDGKNIRLFTYSSTYMAGSTVGNVYSPWTFSLNLDTETNIVSEDIPGILPVTLEEDCRLTGDITVSDASYGFAGAGPNNNCLSIYSKGKYFSYATYGLLTVPTLYQMSILDDPASYYDHLKSDKKHIEVIQTMYVTGAFGSVVQTGARGCHYLAGDYLLFMQTNYQQIQVRMDPTSTFDGIPGFGPTEDRKVSIDNIEKRRVPYIYDETSGERSAGLLMYRGELSGVSSIVDGELVPADTTSITADEWAKLEAWVAPLHANNLYTSEITLCAHDMPGLPLIGVYTWSERVNVTDISGPVYSAAFFVDANVTIGDITSLSNFRVISTKLVNAASVYGFYGVGAALTYLSGNCIAKLADGNIFIAYNSVLIARVVGGATGLEHILIVEPDTLALVNDTVIGVAPHMQLGMQYSKALGIHTLYGDATGTGLYARVYGNTLAEAAAGVVSDVLLIHATPVKVGWTVYFTEATELYIGNTFYTLPITSIDLETTFPTTHKSTIFYVYATVVGGTAEYHLSTEAYTDTGTQLRIGTVTTNNNAIIDIDVKRIISIPNYGNLNTHIDDKYAHGYITEDASVVGGELISNLPVTHTLALPKVWADKITQSTLPTSDISPVVPADLDVWTYTNGVAKLSDVGVTSVASAFTQSIYGDYVLDVTMSSASTSNELVGLVLHSGIHRDSGELVQLVLSRDALSEASVSLSLRGVNYLETIKSYVTSNTLPLDWSGLGNCIIKVKHYGNKLSIQINEFAFLDGGTLIVDDVIDLGRLDTVIDLTAKAALGFTAYNASAVKLDLNELTLDNLDNWNASGNVLNEISNTDSTVAVVTGTIKGGNTIPAIPGYTYGQCDIMISMTSIPPAADRLETSKIVSYTATIDTSGNVTAEYTRGDGTTTTATVSYMVIGIK